MEEEKKLKLENITKKVFEEIFNESISLKIPLITPKNYEKLFLKKIGEEGINIEDFESINSFINNDLDIIDKHYTNINKTISNVSHNTEEAIKAIENKDEETIKFIANKMKLMEKEFKKLINELHTDNLTKAKNQKWLKEKILYNENRFKNNGYLFFLDLNDFKNINDTYGHIIGDSVLQFFTKFIKNFLLKIKLNSELVRYAGDEFLIIIENEDYEFEKLEEFIFLLNKKLEQQKLKASKTNLDTFNISFSFGGSKYLKNDNFREILEKSDEKMYQNKIKLKK